MKKNMKKLLVIALALMPGFSIHSLAQDDGGSNKPEVGNNDSGPIDLGLAGTRPRIVPDEPTDIPIVPFPDSGIPEPRFRNNAQEPHCYYQDGVVYIDADVTVTSITATVTRYADSQVWSGSSITNSLNITASEDPGEYYLKLTLSDGQSYRGKYIIE